MPHEIIPVASLGILASDSSIELARQQRREVVVLEQKGDVPGDYPTFAESSGRRACVNFHFDRELPIRQTR